MTEVEADNDPMISLVQGTNARRELAKGAVAARRAGRPGFAWYPHAHRNS